MKRNLIRLVFAASLAGIGLLLSPAFDLPPLVAAAAAADREVDGAESRELPADAIVFPLKYRGLSGAKNELRYNSYWGFGGDESKANAFAIAVKRKVKKASLVYNAQLKGSEWSVLEVQDGKAVALYFDLNADGALTDNEKIAPTTNNPDNKDRQWEFVTPDFMVKTASGVKVPYRVLLRVNFNGSNNEPNCMWSPSCLLEGTATVAGQTARLILFANGFSGEFNHFGQASYALVSGNQAGVQSDQSFSRESLSSLINYQGQFYHFQLPAAKGSGHPVRAILTKDTSPTGDVAVHLAGDTGLKSRLASARLRGARDDTVHFGVTGGQATLPEGQYKLDQGTIEYGRQNPGEWEVGFTEGPEITIQPRTVASVGLGKPVLAIRAINEKNRYDRDAKEESVYRKGATVYFSPKISGKNNEVYNRFAAKGSAAGNAAAKPPRIRIVNAAGKEMVAKTMEYG